MKNRKMPSVPRLNGKKLLGTVDGLIDKIPPHLRDIIQKASIALGALLALFLVFWSVSKGSKDAIPSGLQIAGSNKDLFYLKELREENEKRRQLVEDVETDINQFPSRAGASYEPAYKPMGKDLLDHLAGEKDEMIQPEHALRPREKAPGYATDNDFATKRVKPDTQTLGNEESDLLKPNQVPKTVPMETGKPAPGFLEEERDVFEPAKQEILKPVKQKPVEEIKRPSMTGKKQQSLDFLE